MIERRRNFSAIAFADRYILNASLEINDAEEDCWAISFLVAFTSSLLRTSPSHWSWEALMPCWAEWGGCRQTSSLTRNRARSGTPCTQWLLMPVPKPAIPSLLLPAEWKKPVPLSVLTCILEQLSHSQSVSSKSLFFRHDCAILGWRGVCDKLLVAGFFFFNFW